MYVPILTVIIHLEIFTSHLWPATAEPRDQDTGSLGWAALPGLGGPLAGSSALQTTVNGTSIGFPTVPLLFSWFGPCEVNIFVG